MSSWRLLISALALVCAKLVKTATTEPWDKFSISATSKSRLARSVVPIYVWNPILPSAKDLCMPNATSHLNQGVLSWLNPQLDLPWLHFWLCPSLTLICSPATNCDPS